METQISATKTVIDRCGKELLESYAQQSLQSIAEGKPVVDGKKYVAATHYYDHTDGKVGTFFTWVKNAIDMRMYVGTEEEIKEMHSDFSMIFKPNSPRERAEERKRKRKREKRKLRKKK